MAAGSGRHERRRARRARRRRQRHVAAPRRGRLASASRGCAASSARSGSSVLNLEPLADVLRHGTGAGVSPVDPTLVRRPGLQLRLAVTALRAASCAS